MNFNKYPSLINEYKVADIEWWIDTFPNLISTEYMLTEKIDGANFQVVLFNGEREKFGKRNSFIGDNSDFFNFSAAITDNDNYTEMMKSIKWTSKLMSGVPIILYSELYGLGINSRVYYGPGRYLRFYDIKEGDKFWPSYKSFSFFNEFEIAVPLVATVTGLEVALNYNNEFISMLTPEDWNGNKEENVAEGYVAKPRNFDIQNNSGSRFVLKSKNKKFKDKEKKPKKEFKPMEGSMKELLDAARSYVNENRLIDLIAKMGPLTEMKQIGPYMKAFGNDWQDDFKSDYAEELISAQCEYGKLDVKNIFKIAGKSAITLVKDHISKEQEEAKERLFS